MIVDSSAVVAILLLEPDHRKFAEAIADDPSPFISAPNLLEAGLVLTVRKGPSGVRALDEFLAESNVRTLPFTADHAAVARQAFLAYGKGRHPAALNFGDCIAYATAKLEMMPLLFKGDDFRKTDIEAAV